MNLMKPVHIFITLIALSVPTRIFGSSSDFSNAIILLIRHAEKPDTGTGLSPEGEQHAQDYVDYFTHYTIQGHPITIDALYATQDSKASMRPRLTLTPLSLALGLPIDTSYDDKQVKELADQLRSHAKDKTVLICWHHGQIPDLLKALGASSKKLLPNGTWPGKEFSWTVQLCYDKHGALIPDLTTCLTQPIPANK